MTGQAPVGVRMLGVDETRAHWHVHRLANLMLTQVRQRMTQQVHGHRGRSTNESWAHRRLLLRGARHLSDGACASCSPPATPPGRSRPPGPARNSYANSWTRSRPPVRRSSSTLDATRTRRLEQPLQRCGPTRSGPGSAVSPPSRPRPTSPNWTAARRPSRPGGRRSRPPCTCGSRTPGPRATTRIKQVERVACGFRNQHSDERRVLLSNTATAT